MEETRILSEEETDQLSRSIKKMKRGAMGGDMKLDYFQDADIDDANQEANPRDAQGVIHGNGQNAPRGMSYRDTLQRNNPNLNLSPNQDDTWGDSQFDVDFISDDDEPPQEDDPICPTITLTKEEKRQLWRPWRNAIIIRMFDKGIGYLQLKRRLKTKWALKGDFSFIDIG